MEKFFIVLPVLLFSVVVHECAHAVAAERCGDPTARMLGRITLNPLPHLDPVGSVLVPLLLVITNASFFFAWAKPVPVNPRNFRNPRRDDMIVSGAGPASNFTLAAIFAVLMILALAFLPGGGHVVPGNWTISMLKLFQYGILINLILAFFNLIPIPPLDGSHILRSLLPYEAARSYDRLMPYGFIILIGLMYFGVLRFLLKPAFAIFELTMSMVYSLAGIL